MMTSWKKLKKLIGCISVILALNACESEVPCSEDVVSRVNAGFYSMADGIEEKHAIGLFSMYGEQRPDSIISGSNVTGIEFPLSMHDTSTRFILTADNLTDTLELSYTTRLKLVSVQCGFTSLFDLRSVRYSGGFIDSVSIIKTTADPGDEQNLKIFL
jgi:hypothetical protein